LTKQDYKRRDELRGGPGVASYSTITTDPGLADVQEASSGSSKGGSRVGGGGGGEEGGGGRDGERRRPGRVPLKERPQKHRKYYKVRERQTDNI